MASPSTTSSEVTPHLATSEIIFRKLLVAVDFSVQTPQVLKTAIAVANCFSSELVLVNATTPVVYGTGVEPVPIETFEVNLESARSMMAALVSSEPALKLIRHHEIVVYANALDLIQKVVEDEKIDLIIAGSHGASGLERLALGSVAESLLHYVSCPVLIVGPHSTFSKKPFRSILYSTDLRGFGLRGAQYASGLAERFHGKLTLLHVIESGAESTTVQPELAESNIREPLERLLPPDLNAYCKATVLIEYGEAGDIITRVARSECASLIVVGIREHKTLADHTPKSTLSQVIREAMCPVLCVRHRLV